MIIKVNSFIYTVLSSKNLLFKAKMTLGVIYYYMSMKANVHTPYA